MAILKRLLVGRPLATTEQEHQRIPKTIALAVFSSDAISSTAYATEEILFVIAVGASSLALGLEHARADRDRRSRVLLAIVVTSYRQTIFAYPSGGGTYVVSRENLGENPSLVAGASLLVDYILTVAVSISAGVAAIISIPAFHGLAEHRVAARPRADRAASRSPTCAASRSRAASSRYPRTSTSSMPRRARSCYGLVPQSFFGDISTDPVRPARRSTATTVSRRHARALPPPEGLLVGRGRAHRRRGDLQRRARVPPARVEERRDHARVDGRHPRHAVLRRLDARPPPRARTRATTQTVIVAAGPAVFGNGAVCSCVLQFATAAILDPRRQHRLRRLPAPVVDHRPATATCPRQLANRGDRLVFSNGIIVLAGAAGVAASSRSAASPTR